MWLAIHSTLKIECLVYSCLHLKMSAYCVLDVDCGIKGKNEKTNILLYGENVMLIIPV